MPELRILAIGDIVGSPGRRAVTTLLPKLISDEKLGFVVANAENAAGGSGITPQVVTEMLAAGCNVLTTGDHVFKNRDGLGIIERELRVLRPANFARRAIGRGWGVFEVGQGVEGAGLKVAVINMLGRSFMGAPADNPFERIDDVLAELTPAAPDLILLDFHAEATAEKIAMGRLLDGRAAAIWGTHTHVPTADEQLLSGGTGYITDIGMTGPHDSIIGREVAPVLATLVTGMPERWDVGNRDVRLSGAIFTIDTATKRCTGVRRIQAKMA